MRDVSCLEASNSIHLCLSCIHLPPVVSQSNRGHTWTKQKHTVFRVTLACTFLKQIEKLRASFLPGIITL